MSKLQEIKTAQLTARKERETVVATLLTTIIGEAIAIGKTAGNRESTDAEVLQVLKKFEKNQLENIAIYRKAGLTEKLVAAETEVSIIRQFLPAKLSDAEVQDDIKFVIATQGLAIEQKSLGVITKQLKQKHGDQFDGQQVSTVFKNVFLTISEC